MRVRSYASPIPFEWHKLLRHHITFKEPLERNRCTANDCSLYSSLPSAPTHIAQLPVRSPKALTRIVLIKPRKTTSSPSHSVILHRFIMQCIKRTVPILSARRVIHRRRAWFRPSRVVSSVWFQIPVSLRCHNSFPFPSKEIPDRSSQAHCPSLSRSTENKRRNVK